ncbi:MAG: CRTAC1 family protein [Acidobacteriota bacterium]
MRPMLPRGPRPTTLALFALCAVVAQIAGGEEPVFLESAERLGIDFEHFNGMVGKLYFPEMAGGGVALFDFDGDGDLDVYLGQGNLFGSDAADAAVLPSKYPLPTTDRLYRNDLSSGEPSTLSFTDATEAAGLAAQGYNMGAIAGDLDDDGDVDLYVTNIGQNHLLRNDGGRFTDVTAEAKAGDERWTVAASLIDFDRDGRLDLFLGNYVEFRMALHKDCTSSTGAVDYCGPLSYAAQGNRLLRNLGEMRFESVTAKALSGNPAATTLGTVVGDFDSNGWPDLYVANDQVPNHLWMNQGDGTFLEDALFAGAAVDSQGQPQASMGVVAGDLDGDGHEDLFMTHLRMEMNMIYINDGSGLFTDKALPSGLGRSSFPFTGFGAALFDYDNDGVLDLYVSNGAVKRNPEQVRLGRPLALEQTNQLFRGSGGGSFTEIEGEARIDAVYSEVSRGVAVGDLDNDGDSDLVVTNNGGKVRVLLNQVGSKSRWLGVRLTLPGSGRDALGARVSLAREGLPTLHRRVRTDGSYVSSHDPRVLFGLGDSEPKSLEVIWPDGSAEVFGADRLPVGQYVTLVQGSGTAK